MNPALAAEGCVLLRTGIFRSLPQPSQLQTYRLLWPRDSFLVFFLLEPRGVVRAALGAAFLRAVRLIFFRSNLSSTFLVFAIIFLVYTFSS